MMAKRWYGLVLLAAILLAAVTIVGVGDRSAAAPLTGGNYTYVANGEEVNFPFDPVVRKDGTLLPVEVFQYWGVTVTNPLEKSITLAKDGVGVKVTLGSTAVELGGKVTTVATAPLRLSGRLFLPADLLKEFGVEFGLDGNYVVMRSYVDGTLQVVERTPLDFDSLKRNKSFTAAVRGDTGVYMDAEFILLTPEIIQSSNLPLNYGARTRMLSMLQSNTLVLVKLSNKTAKAAGLATSGLYLVDDLRNQYDPVTVMDVGQGLLSNKLAPAADRVGVLVYPKVDSRAGILTLYSDANGANLGAFLTR